MKSSQNQRHTDTHLNLANEMKKTARLAKRTAMPLN